MEPKPTQVLDLNGVKYTAANILAAAKNAIRIDVKPEELLIPEYFVVLKDVTKFVLFKIQGTYRIVAASGDWDGTFSTKQKAGFEKLNVKPEFVLITKHMLKSATAKFETAEPVRSSYIPRTQDRYIRQQNNNPRYG